CSEVMARQSAAVMLQVDPSAVQPEDIDDALGELTSMIGGNFKALLPELCRLDLPTVRTSVGYQVRLPRAAQVLQCSFRWGSELFAVVVLQTVPADVTA